MSEVISDFESEESTEDSDDFNSNSDYDLSDTEESINTSTRSRSLSEELQEELSKITSEEEDIIDEKYLNNCKICLTDFGNIINDGEIFNENDEVEEIQTRYYRAPEVIMGLEYDNKVKNFTRDMYHMNMIKHISGNFPEEMIKKSPR